MHLVTLATSEGNVSQRPELHAPASPHPQGARPSRAAPRLHARRRVAGRCRHTGRARPNRGKPCSHALFRQFVCLASAELRASASPSLHQATQTGCCNVNSSQHVTAFRFRDCRAGPRAEPSAEGPSRRARVTNLPRKGNPFRPSLASARASPRPAMGQSYRG
jgi:hypothetical protein